MYEHVVIAEKYLKRELRSDEIVHHLDGDRSNNRKENLLVLERGQHTKLHEWFKRGAPGIERFGVDGVNSGKSRVSEPPRICQTCGKTLQEKQKCYCSPSCRGSAKRKTKKPSAETLKREMQENSMLALGRKYGVSDNAVRKWARSYGIL